MGSVVKFDMSLIPSGDTSPWHEYNRHNPHVTCWLHDDISGSECPRFEVGHGPVHFAMHPHDIEEALQTVLSQVRTTARDES